VPQVYWRNETVALDEKMSTRDNIVHMPAAEVYTGLDPVTSTTDAVKRDEIPTQPYSPQETWKRKAEVHRPAPSVFTKRDHPTTPSDSETEALLHQITSSTVADPTNTVNDNTILHPAPGSYRREIIHSDEADHHSLPPTGGVALRLANAVYGEVGHEE
jgi:hypothetical protein